MAQKAEEIVISSTNGVLKKERKTVVENSYGKGFYDKNVMKLPINLAAETLAIFIGCMERRLHTIYPIIMTNLFGFHYGEFFKKTPAGAVSEIVFNENSGRESELKQISIALKAGVNTIVICVHTDCSMDGGSSRFSSKQEEILFQWDKAEKARNMILEEFLKDYPDLVVHLVLAEIDNDEVHIIQRVRG